MRFKLGDRSFGNGEGGGTEFFPPSEGARGGEGEIVLYKKL